jgi:phage terminase small subunit
MLKAWITAVARKNRETKESILGEEEEPAEVLPWHTHEWSTNEVDFVAAYMRTGDECRAYREAWRLIRSESERAWMLAGVKGRQLLDKPWMSSYLAELQAKLRQRMKLDSASILEELAKLGFANMSDFVVLQADGTPQFDLSELSREQAAAISELTIDTYMDGRGEDAREVRSVKVKLAPKTAALELMGKHFKMWTDVQQVVGDEALADEIREARRRKQERRRGGNDGETDADNDGGAEPAGSGE